MLRIAVPNKGSLSEKAVEFLTEAGYKTRKDTKTLSVVDEDNGVEFFYLRPKDIATYVSSGHLDMGITGRDLAADTTAELTELLPLGFGDSRFFYAVSDTLHWDIDDLAGKRIATSYPHLVKQDLARRGINADVIRLDGAVEISVQLGVADAIADVVSTGRTLQSHDLHTIGEPLLTSEAVVIGQKDEPVTQEQKVFLQRIRGIIHAHNYVMLDYNVEKKNLADATAISPGISAPTISPLTDENWVAVRAMIPRKKANKLMDQLSMVGAEAIIATDLRIARI